MKKQIALLLFLAVSRLVSAQSVEEQLTQKRVSCYEVISNASNLLPGLYQSRSFDSIQQALQVATQYCDSSNEPLLYLQILLDIQQSRFSLSALQQSNRVEKLQQYARWYRRFYSQTNPASRYSFHDDAYTKVYHFIQRWAKDLLAGNKLTDTEALICNVLAGNIKNPQAVIKANRQKYPELYAELRDSYAAQRNEPIGNAAFLSGVWFPTGKATLLGAHPFFGFQVGGRNRLNELDLNIEIRFVNTAHSYTYFRKDSLYTTNYFLGGYIGLDYTRYLVHTTNFEMGVIGGVAYDGFDLTEETKGDNGKTIEPYTIGCLNLNAGLRANYYFNPHFYIGIGGKFNKLNYKNKGGTDLQGNAVSVTLFIGG